jgi:hypothetical protein
MLPNCDNSDGEDFPLPRLPSYVDSATNSVSLQFYQRLNVKQLIEFVQLHTVNFMLLPLALFKMLLNSLRYDMSIEICFANCMPSFGKLCFLSCMSIAGPVSNIFE